MYSYIKGVITIIEPSYVVLENNGIGYMIFVANPYSYREGSEEIIYIYQQIREDENTLYGFKSKEEKDLFMKLISVKGLGCKMALPMLSTNIEYVFDAINTDNVNYLKKFPKVGDKVARQIILDLKGKLAADPMVEKKDLTDLTDTLKSLGYKAPDIKRILPNIDGNEPLEKQVREALKLLMK